MTDYFPVRRSERKTKKTVLEERQRDLEYAILAEKEDGLEVFNFFKYQKLKKYEQKITA